MTAWSGVKALTRKWKKKQTKSQPVELVRFILFSQLQPFPHRSLRFLKFPQESMDSLHRRLERSRQMQTVLRAFEARDRNLLEDNLWRVSFWSCASVLVMLCVALTQVSRELEATFGANHLSLWITMSNTIFLLHSQVYTVRKLFDDKRRVCT